MDIKRALDAFTALSQETRLRVFRLLIKAGADGMAAGEMAQALEVRQNTLSANLSVLLQAGLVRNQREGRSIRYFTDTEGLGALLTFLLEECCGGQADMCAPLIETITCACEGAANGKC